MLFPRNLRILTVLFLGFSSGLPLALTGSTLQAWFTEAGVDLMTIGVLSLVGIPYVWKFLWAPLMDRFALPWLGRRRGWIFSIQLGLCIALFCLANMNPLTSPGWMGCIALLIAFLSASQDIVIDAYRADLLFPEERGVGAAGTIFGFRLAMLLSGGLALIMAQYLGWQNTYKIMAILMGISIFATYLGPEPKQVIRAPVNFRETVIQSFADLLKREGITTILLFVLCYKIGDALALSLMSNFLLKTLHFSLAEVGFAFKTVGLLATILGAFTGGALLIRMNLYWALLLFGMAQAFSNLMFMALAYVGKSYALMISAMFIENYCSGMSTAALMAFLMMLCNQQFSATQYASLSALSAVGRVFLGPVAAAMVLHMGWTNFFLCSFLLCFPGIILLSLLRTKVKFNVQLAGA